MRHDPGTTTGITARRVTDEADRRCVIEILAATYDREKHWITDAETQISPDDLERNDIAWFLVTLGDQPAGTLRVLFDPPYLQYAAYGLKLLDPNLRVEEFIRHNRIAEVGRFAVKPEFRGQFMVAVALMRTASEETVARGYTHLVTDVFEDDPHTPYRFHTRVLGFRPVATHDVGELHCRSRRITLLLDLDRAYERFNKSRNWLYRYLTGGWEAALHRRSGSEPVSQALVQRSKPKTHATLRTRRYAEIPVS